MGSFLKPPFIMLTLDSFITFVTSLTIASSWGFIDLDFILFKYNYINHFHINQYFNYIAPLLIKMDLIKKLHCCVFTFIKCHTTQIICDFYKISCNTIAITYFMNNFSLKLIKLVKFFCISLNK